MLSVHDTIMTWVIRSKTSRLLFAILSLSVFLHLSEKNLRSSCHLPEKAYFSSTILVGGLTQSWAFSAMLLCTVLGAILYRKRRSNDCRGVLAFRYLVLASAATLTWAAAIYPYNYYFDHSRHFDRFTIVILCLGLIRWPSLVGIFVVDKFAILSQFDQPFGGFSWTDKDLPLRVLLLFGASLWLSITARSSRMDACRIADDIRADRIPLLCTRSGKVDIRLAILWQFPLPFCGWSCQRLA